MAGKKRFAFVNARKAPFRDSRTFCV